MSDRLPLGGPQKIALSRLHESPDNPRRITDDALERLAYSLDKAPQMLEARPLVALPTGEVVGGNQRLKAARVLKWDSIFTYVADLTPAERREWLLRDNTSAGSWEDEALAALVAQHAEQAGDMKLLGFADAEMNALLRLAAEPSGGGGGRDLGDPDARPPELPTEPRCKPGELYLLGEHRLFVGDATTPEANAALFADRAEADLMLTDPPYGVSYQGKSIYGTAPGENASSEEWNAYWTYRKKREKLMRRAVGSMELQGDERGVDLASLVAVVMGNAPLKAGGAFYVFAPGGASMSLFFEGLEVAALPHRHELIWLKDRFALGLQDYHYRHEPILYGWKPGAAHFFVDDRKQDTVLECQQPRSSRDHPTMKPVELLRRLIRNSSRRGELVYDPFGGSGSTLIAAHAEQRICRMAEIDPAYATVIVERFEEYTKIDAQAVTPAEATA